MPQSAYPKGDSFVCSIAAASIVAKVHRDALMRELDARYPVYGFGATWATRRAPTSPRSASTAVARAPALVRPVRAAARGRDAQLALGVLGGVSHRLSLASETL
jgi:ribonuclease HII